MGITSSEREQFRDGPGSEVTYSQPAITIAVVGDVHDLWEPEDGIALHNLGVHLVLLVGDFGNEAVDVVRAVAELDLPKAVILGNHDAWYSATDWGRKLRSEQGQGDRVQQQLELLGDSHVGYGKLDFPHLGLTVVGGRPFSWGGPVWKNGDFYQARYGINSFEASTAKIVEAAAQATQDTLIFIGHCGPTGLGDQPEDPCGRDWKPLGGDHGDPDLQEAIALVRQSGKHIPLVTFGHMHHHLRHTQDRLRKMIDVQTNGTVYLNAASVPRIVETEAGRIRNFSLVTLHNGTVTKAALVWVNRDGLILSESVLYQQPQPTALSLS